MFGNFLRNRREALACLTGGAIIATVLSANDAQAGDDDVEVAKLPKPVKDAIDRILPGATWLSAIKVVEGDKIAYEIDGSDAKKRDTTVLVTAEGKVVEVEFEQRRAGNVPDKVLDAVKKEWPKFDLAETHHIRQGKDLVTESDGEHLYDLRGTVAKDRFIEVEVTADGAILDSTVEVNLDKVPAVVTNALKKARPKFEIETAYAIREEKTLIGYHFEGKGSKGQDRTISVTPDGKQIEVIE